MWADGLDMLGKELGRSSRMMGYSSCTPVLHYVPSFRPEYTEIFKEALNHVIQSLIRKVVLAGFWSSITDNMKSSEISDDTFERLLRETIELLQKSDKTVFILLDIPELDSEQMLREKFFQSLRMPVRTITSMSLERHESQQADVTMVIASLQRTHGISVLDPAAHICPDTMCVVAENGRTLYQDRHHLTDAGGRKFNNVFKPLFDMK